MVPQRYHTKSQVIPEDRGEYVHASDNKTRQNIKTGKRSYSPCNCSARQLCPQDSPRGSDLYILKSVVRRVLVNAQWVTLGGRRLMTCSLPPAPACKVMETAVWSRCQGHYQRKGLPAVAPSHRKLPTHPNKGRHKCTCCCLQGERDKMTL